MSVMCSTVHAAVTDAMHGATSSRFAGLKRAFLEQDLRHSEARAEVAQAVVQGAVAAHHGETFARRHAGGGAGRFGADPFLQQEMRGTDRLMGRTALHHAAYVGDEGLVRRLLAAGADSSAEDSWDGSTPLDVALARNRGSIARALVEAGGVGGGEYA